MRSFVLAAVLVAAALAVSHKADGGWSPLKRVAERLTKIESSVDFRNESTMPIVVVVDSNRERYEIAPGGRTTFGNCNVGDAPTFRVQNMDGKVLHARRVKPLGVRGSFGWNGSNFKKNEPSSQSARCALTRFLISLTN